MYKIIKNQNKAASFVNVVSINEDPNTKEITYVEENVNDISGRGDNIYKGWYCWSGIESLQIDADGTVWNATCMVEKLGNIHTDFDIPNFPITCTKPWCVCAADLNTSKAKSPEYFKLLRINRP